MTSYEILKEAIERWMEYEQRELNENTFSIEEATNIVFSHLENISLPKELDNETQIN